VQVSGGAELTTEEWQRVLREASALGVLHVLFSGGEPLGREDLPELVAGARASRMYTNLITSGVGLTRVRLQELCAAGLENIQISFQADEAVLANQFAGAVVHTRKLAAAALVKDVGLPLTLNVVLHRENIERLPEIITLAERLDAQRLELAHTQYLGWAFLNKTTLLPTRVQLERAEEVANAAIARLRGKMEILYVLPDYYQERPKPCLHGWGQRYLTVNPFGDVLPCQTAGQIPGLEFANVRAHGLDWIWHESSAFQKFRGTDWLPEPCQSCAFRERDFGGCRCQAFLLTGDVAQTDPVCAFSPHHERITSLVEQIQVHVETTPLHMRTNPVVK
jgi:pyrroloquinoline quinone biosynthesis protein E